MKWLESGVSQCPQPALNLRLIMVFSTTRGPLRRISEWENLSIISPDCSFCIASFFFAVSSGSFSNFSSLVAAISFNFATSVVCPCTSASAKVFTFGELAIF